MSFSILCSGYFGNSWVSPVQVVTNIMVTRGSDNNTLLLTYGIAFLVQRGDRERTLLNCIINVVSTNISDTQLIFTFCITGPAQVPMMSHNGAIPPIYVPPGYVSQVIEENGVRRVIVLPSAGHGIPDGHGFFHPMHNPPGIHPLFIPPGAVSYNYTYFFVTLCLLPHSLSPGITFHLFW